MILAAHCPSWHHAIVRLARCPVSPWWTRFLLWPYQLNGPCGPLFVLHAGSPGTRVQALPVVETTFDQSTNGSVCPDHGA